MNMSTLITKFKIKLGIYSIALPIKDVNGFIQEVIETITIPAFSVYCPTYDKFRFKLCDLKCLEKESNYETYLLPDIFKERELLFVKDIYYDEARISGVGYWGGGVPILNGNMINNVILSNAALPVINKMIPKITFKYKHPREVTLWNVFASEELIFELALQHDKTLASISPTQEIEFESLAILDVSDALYQVLKHYPEIQSAYGQINLKIDDLAQAAEQRKQLISEWDNIYHIDIEPFIYA